MGQRASFVSRCDSFAPLPSGGPEAPDGRELRGAGPMQMGWHLHDLVLGRYSVHTSPGALRQGEGEIVRLGRELRAKGRL